MNEQKELNEFISLQVNRVKNNVTIVSKNDLRFPFLLHIDRVVPKKFIPSIPVRAAPLEDKTIARVTVADTLLGCMLAYGNIYYDYNILKTINYKISKLDFECAIKPNKKLVYDSKETNEYWLVPYNEKHASYKPIEIGNFFLNDLRFKEISIGNKPIIIVTYMSIYCCINEEMSFSSSKVLKPGFYRILFNTESMYSNNYSYKNDRDFTIEVVSKIEFNKEKLDSITMLNNSSKTTPLYGKW